MNVHVMDVMMSLHVTNVSQYVELSVCASIGEEEKRKELQTVT